MEKDILENSKFVGKMWCLRKTEMTRNSEIIEKIILARGKVEMEWKH